MRLSILLILATFMVSCGLSNNNLKTEKNGVKQEVESHFKLVETKEIKNLGATSYTYEHIKTGAKVVYIDDGSEEKTFSIAFKTPVVDNTGVNHVFEHSVLAGSEKFPDKNLFSELDTKNLPTFYNAMTGTDYTIYPFSAVEPKSYDNLMDVYLDAVFNPMVLENENILKREGWRYDRDPNTGNLIYNGIVYNEMRGAFSNPFSTLFYKLNLLTFTDENANYGFSSGGIPSEIPNLTIEQLRKTHAKYYTPSNSIVVLAGKMDINKHLALLDTYFSKYDKSEKAELVLQKTPLKDVLHNETYPAPAGSPNLYIYTTLMEPKTPSPELFFITSLLANYEISPLKKLFKEKKFHGSFSFETDISAQSRGYIIVQGANKDELGEIRKTMDAKLKDLAENGIDQEVVDLAIRAFKKSNAKSQYSKQRAEDLGSSISKNYFYFDKPLLTVSDDALNTLEELSKNPDEIKALIKKYYIDNHNKMEVFFTPNPEGMSVPAVEEREKLHKVEASLTEKQKEALDKDIHDFNIWAKSTVPKEIVDTIPSISLEDLKNSNAPVVKRTEETIDGVKFIDNDINTYDLNLVSLKFDSSGLTKEEKLDLLLYSYLFSTSGTKDYSFEEVSSNLTKYFLKLDVTNKTTVIDTHNVSRKFTVYFEYLQNDHKEVYKTLEELLFSEKFDNKLKIKTTLNLIKDHLINSSSDSMQMNALATLNSNTMFNPDYYYVLEEELSIGLLEKLNTILADYDNEFPKLQKEMITIREKVLNKNKMEIFYANNGNYDNFKKDILPLIKKIKNEPITPVNYSKLETQKLAIVAPVRNGSTAWSNNLTNLGFEKSGKYKIMANILNEHLNNVIRIQNGAYGAYFFYTVNGGLIATTYRDGEIDKTLTAYEEMPQYLKSIKDIPQEKFNGYILKSMAKYYQSYTPDQLMGLSYTHYLYGFSPETLNNEKNEVLATSKDDIDNFVEVMTKFSAKKNYTTVNGKEIIDAKVKKYKFDNTIKYDDVK